MVSGEYWMRHPGFPHTILKYTRAEWDAFLAGVQSGEFDDLLPDKL